MFLTVLAFGIALVVMLFKIGSLENDVKEFQERTSKRSKMTRIALAEIAALANKKIVYHDFIERVSVTTLNWDKECEQCQAIEVLRKEVIGKIDKLAAKAESVDLQLSQGVDVLATHLKLEIIPFHQKEELGFRIIKLKK